MLPDASRKPLQLQPETVGFGKANPIEPKRWNAPLLAASVVAVAASAFPAHAEDNSEAVRLLTKRLNQIESDNRALRERVKGLEAKVGRQGREQQETRARVRRATNIANAAAANGAAARSGVQQPAPPPVWISFHNGPLIETEDKAYSFKPGGRLLMDGGGSSRPETGYSGLANFDQAWLQVEGRIARIWEYKFSYDFANTSTAGGALGGIRDAYLVLNHPALTLPFATAPVAIQVGNQWEPHGLERTTSKLTTDFMERALASDVFGASRHFGASLSTHGANWSVKGGIFSTSPEDRAFVPTAAVPVPYWVSPRAGWVATGGGQYFDIAGRATYAPVFDSDRLLHFGVSGRYHQPNDSTGINDDRVLLLGSNARTEAEVLKINLLGTPDLSCGAVAIAGNPVVAGKCVRDVFSYGAEFVGSYGPFSLQAEYLGAHYDRRGGSLALANAAGIYAPGGASLDFNGYYVYGTWYLTGESRAAAYSLTSPNNPATFGQIKILKPLSAGGWGAWELAARYSSINLNNGPFQGGTFANFVALAPNAATRAYVANSSVNGGREQDVTVGLNWYPDTGIRFMANWTHVVSLVAPWNRPYLNGAHPNVFTLRAQVDW
jgi:phosphate-selective porin OprO/OprP